MHKLTPFSHGSGQKLQNAICYDPYILLVHFQTFGHTRTCTPVAGTTHLTYLKNQQLYIIIPVLNPSKQLDLKHTQLELDYDKLKAEKGSRASIVQEANADLLRELERYSGQLKDTLKENGELKTLYLQVCGISFCQLLHPRKVQIISRGNLLPG